MTDSRLMSSEQREAPRPPPGAAPDRTPTPRPRLDTLSMHPNVRRILKGPLALEVGRFGVPLAIGMGLQTTFNLVDAYIIGRLGGTEGRAAVAAIANCDYVAAVGTILSYGLSIATGTLISRRHGEGDEDGVRRIAWQSTLLILFISAAFALLGLLGSDFLLGGAMQAKGKVLEQGVPYLQVSMGGSVTVFLLLHLVTIQRALGSSKTPITMLIFANAANLLLAVLFVYGPGDAPAVFAWGPPLAELLGIPRMGLVGAGWATVIARGVALLPTFVVTFHRHDLFRKDSRQPPDRRVMRKIWDLGWPTSSQLVVRIMGILAVIAIAQRGYTTAQDQDLAAALGVVLRWETMAMFVGLGWGSASQTFMGQNLGAGNIERAKASGYYVMVYNSIMMALFALACFVWGQQMIAFLAPGENLVELGLAYFHWVSPSYVGLGVGIVLGSAIQGAGATRQTFILDLAVILMFQVPACWFVVRVLDAPATALWQTVALTYLASAIVYVIAYRRGSYLETQLH